MVQVTVGAGAVGFGGAEEGHEGAMQRGGDVHGAGVVGDQQRAEANPLNHFGQGGDAAKVVATLGRAGDDLRAQRLFVLAAEEGETRGRQIGGELADQFAKMFDWPALVDPACARLQQNPAGAVSVPFGADRLGHGWARRQPREILVHGNAECGERGKIPIDGVGVIAGARDGQIVKTTGTFANFIEPHQQFTCRQPSEGPATSEALKVEDEVETLGAHPADTAEHFGPVAGVGPATAFKPDQAGQVGVPLEKRSETGINPPINLRGGVVLFEEPQDGQRVDDVAERTGLEEQDFQRP